MHNTQAIEQHVRKVATRNGLSVKKSGNAKRASYTVTEQNDRVVFSATSVDDVDYFLKLHTGHNGERCQVCNLKNLCHLTHLRKFVL